MPEAERMSDPPRTPSIERVREIRELKSSDSRKGDIQSLGLWIDHLTAELAEERGKRERMGATLRLTLEEAKQHPLCMDIAATDEEINREGGDAAFVTVIAQRCHAALTTAQEPQP